jgi:hypothetical protein
LNFHRPTVPGLLPSAVLCLSALVLTSLRNVSEAAQSTGVTQAVQVVDGVFLPGRPVPEAIVEVMRFLKKADGGYVPGTNGSDLAGYFTSTFVKPDGTRSDRKLCFPARQHAYFIFAFLRYYAYTGEQEWLLRARDLADWNLAHSTTAQAAYAHVPYSTCSDGKPGGSRDGNSIEPDKAAFLGSAYIPVYEATRQCPPCVSEVHGLGEVEADGAEEAGGQ